MATNFTRSGYGQVEPNHLSAQRTSQIYAQLPAKSSITQLENGQFVKYDYATGTPGEVNFTGAGEWMMVFNEVKLYGDQYYEGYRDYAMKADDFTGGSSIVRNVNDLTGSTTAGTAGTMVPRVIKTNIGDIFTTNTLGVAGSYRATATYEDSTNTLARGSKLVPDTTTGFLKIKATPAATDMVWQVIAITTMADGQSAVKLMRIQ